MASGRLWRLIFTLALGGIFWLVAASAQAATPTPMTLPGGLTTTTTVFELGEEAQAQMDGLTARVQTAQAELTALSDALNENIDEYYQCRAGLNAATARLAQLRREVDDARAKKAQAQDAFAMRIKAVYMSGGRDQLLQMLVLADGLQDLYNRVRLVTTLADQDSRIVSDLEDRTDRLDLLVQAFDGERREELTLKQQLSRQATQLLAAKSREQEILAGLDGEVKAVVERERQRQLAEQARLQAELEARMAAARQQLLSGGLSRPRGSDVLTPGQIAIVAQEAGFTGHDLVIAVAVALAESGGNANAIGDVTIGGSFGLWQVFCKAHPHLIPPEHPDSVAWYDPYQNARWAYEISGGNNWRPWSTFKHGTYQAFMDIAQEAVVQLITGL